MVDPFGGVRSELVGKGGKLVVTSVTPISETSVSFSMNSWVTTGRSLIGNLAAFTNPVSDFYEMWRLSRSGQMQLSQMITKTYSLDDVNDGYTDMNQGTNIRGAVVFD